MLIKETMCPVCVCMCENQWERIIVCVYLVLIIIFLLMLNAEGYKQQQNGALYPVKQIFDNAFDIMKYL